jgi:hypothetical protein
MTRFSVLFSLCVVLFATDPSQAATTLADAFVTPGPTNHLAANNYGGGGALAVSGSSTANGTFASVLKFDISTDVSAFNTTYGVGGWTITGVSLQLTTSTANNPIFNPSVAGQFSIDWLTSDSWVEGSGMPNMPSATGVNYNNLSSLLSGSQSQGVFSFASVLDGVTGTYSFSPSGGLLSDILTGGQLSFAINAVDSNMSAVFNSRSFGTPSRRPALTLFVTAIPEPGRILLLVGGLVPVVFSRRRSPFQS